MSPFMPHLSETVPSLLTLSAPDESKPIQQTKDGEKQGNGHIFDPADEAAEQWATMKSQHALQLTIQMLLLLPLSPLHYLFSPWVLQLCVQLSVGISIYYKNFDGQWCFPTHWTANHCTSQESFLGK